MRITSFMIFDQLTRAMQQQTEQFGRLSEQMSTGKKINKPSDDVPGMRNAMGYRLSLQSYDQYNTNGQQADTLIKFTESVEALVSKSLFDLKSLVRTADRDIFDDTARPLDAAQAFQLRDQLLEMGNMQFDNRYIFSGYRTDTQAYNSVTYNYQGDSGVMNVMIDQGATVQVNDPGSNVFSAVFTAPTVVPIQDYFVHYTPGAGTLTNVEIRASDDTTVLDTFSFSNVIQAADILGNAINAQDARRIEALSRPLEMVAQSVINIESGNHLRLKQIDDQKKFNTNSISSITDFLSRTEDADLTEVITELKQIQVALSAMQASSAQMLQQSLMDFLS
ncbi:MAG: flagellar hook-associated protein FlgL [Nitrospirae bacterium]|nr:flagellar hook-associated protein FlgL [Nitrospirota bacterium]